MNGLSQINAISLVGESINKGGISDFESNQNQQVHLKTLSTGRGAVIETCRRIMPMAPMSISGISTGQAFQTK